MNIECIGWYDHHNVGDEAYKLAFPKLLHNNNIRFLESVSGRDDIDLTILGGGDVVCDYFIDKVLKNKSSKKIAASVTITPGSNTQLANKVFDKIYVRDTLSYETAKNVIGTDKLRYLPDFTFVLDGNKDKGFQMVEDHYKQEGLCFKGKYVIICISSYIGFLNLRSANKDFVSFLKLSHDIGEVVDNNPDISFVFLPFSTMTPNDDRVPNSFVSARSEKMGRSLVVYDRLSVQNTLDIITGASAVISTRLHCTIFSTIAGVPFIDITHHDKNYGFLKTLGKTDWSIPFWQFDARLCNNLLNKHISNQSEIESLKNYTLSARNDLYNAKNEISSYLQLE